MGAVTLLGTRTYLALDASSATAAEVSHGVKTARLRTLAREPLAAGALLPGPAGANLADPEAVHAALSRALARVGRGRVTLVLPDGVARLALVEVPAAVEPREYVRFRLAPSLPWPAAEASVEALAAGGSCVVGAAIGRASVAEYEQAAVAAGAQVEQVFLAPLLALAGLLRAGSSEAVHAVLGDVALCLALVRDGGLAGLRSRRRDRSSGEATRIAEEARRLLATGGNGHAEVPLALVGSDAGRLRADIGLPATRPLGAADGEGASGDEAGWLEGLLR
jgi:hypothetical protein